MNELDQQVQATIHTDEAAWPIFICLLGNFRLLKTGKPVVIRSGGKAESLLCQLALRYGHRVPRAMLVGALWSTSDSILANQSLNSLVYSLHKLIGDALGNTLPVLHEEGFYRLNVEAGVGVDVACFDAFTQAGDQQFRAGNLPVAAEFYSRSVRLYRGDLYSSTDVHAVIERERLRA